MSPPAAGGRAAVLPAPPAPCTFTVFTPTFNRARTLPRVYRSLRAQTFRDFEWLVVDDGSTDDTAALLERFRREAPFPVRVLRQENRGKHVAFNRAVAAARGALFLTLDSDDACVPEALERFMHHWLSIPEAERPRFSAVTALCADEQGRIVGDRFPRDPLDSDSLEIRYRYRVRGEKWGFQRTDVLRRFPYPEPPVRSYVPESIVWCAIAREYLTRYVNEPLRIYHADEPAKGGGSERIMGAGPERHAPGHALWHRTILTAESDWFRFAPLEFLRSAVHYVRFSLHAGDGLRKQCRALAGPRAFLARLLWVAGLVPGIGVYLRDLWRGRAARRGAAPGGA